MRAYACVFTVYRGLPDERAYSYGVSRYDGVMFKRARGRGHGVATAAGRVGEGSVGPAASPTTTTTTPSPGKIEIRFK